MTRPIPVKGRATKKPVSVAYIQITDETINEIVNTWAVGFVTAVPLDIPGTDKKLVVLKVDTLEGPVYAQRGDFILKGRQEGEFWPVREDIFHETYDVVHQPVMRTDAHLQDPHVGRRGYVPTQGDPVAYDGENLREKKFTGAEPSLDDKLRDLGFEPEPEPSGLDHDENNSKGGRAYMD
jgi:hypothetical protein